MLLYIIYAGIILLCLVLEINYVLTLLKGTLGIVFSLLSVYRQYVKYVLYCNLKGFLLLNPLDQACFGGKPLVYAR